MADNLVALNSELLLSYVLHDCASLDSAHINNDLGFTSQVIDCCRVVEES